MRREKVAFLTNVLEYVGPAAGPALVDEGFTVFCHDYSFEERAARKKFEAENPGHVAAEATDPASFVEEGLRRFDRIDCLVSNEVPRNISYSLDAAALDGVDDLLLDAENYVESLLGAPIRLVRAALPSMKAQGQGSILFITSGAPIRNPVMRIPHGYLAGRAGANALVKGLAVELAPIGIQVNAIAPFFVYSRNAFPSEDGADSPEMKAIVNALVPAQRVGRWDEIAPLIKLLTTGESGFLSGQIIAFSGAGA